MLFLHSSYLLASALAVPKTTVARTTRPRAPEGVGDARARRALSLGGGRCRGADGAFRTCADDTCALPESGPAKRAFVLASAALACPRSRARRPDPGRARGPRGSAAGMSTHKYTSLQEACEAGGEHKTLCNVCVCVVNFQQPKDTRGDGTRRATDEALAHGLPRSAQAGEFERVDTAGATPVAESHSHARTKGAGGRFDPQAKQASSYRMCFG